MSLEKVLLFGVVIFITHFLEGITGFGCTVLALPFCIMLVGVKMAVPALVLLAWIMALFIVIIAFKHILWRKFGHILFLMLLGLPIGIYIFANFPETTLKILLGIFMVIVSMRGIYVSFFNVDMDKEKETDKVEGRFLSIKSIILNVILFFGGIIHGAFGTGGPFVVIYATRAIDSKENFRATLCMLWLTLNTIIIGQNFLKGSWGLSEIKFILWVLPFLVAGMILGNIAHKKVKDVIFTKIVYFVLLLSGIVILYNR